MDTSRASRHAGEKKAGMNPPFGNKPLTTGLRFDHHCRLHFIFDNHRFLMKSAAVAS
jgi:hypothetical protein